MNTNLIEPISHLLEQIKDLLQGLSQEQYAISLPVLSGATLGQHTRHILEFYLELINQYESGKINYDARKRDHLIESNPQFATSCLTYVLQQLDKRDKPMELSGKYEEQGETFTIATNYYRELVYNLEHTVHHMALIRIGVRHLLSLDLAENFGVASSTLQYRKACAR